MIGNEAGRPLSVLALLVAALATGPAATKTVAGAYLDLEPSLRSSALVVAVRVDDVSPISVVYGGKNMQTLHRYTFTPVRILKGVYSRPQLRLTSADLHPYNAYFEPGDMRSGGYRLLLLGRSAVGYYGIHPGERLEEAFPELTGADDPLLDASETLLGLQDENDRLAIVSRLALELQAARSRGAVMLLAALERRREVAAQHAPAFEAVAGQLSAGDARVVEAAARVLGRLLQADYLGNASAHAAAVAALHASLRGSDLPLTARVAALQAMTFAVGALRDNDDAVRLVQLEAPHDTFAERAARLDILGRLHAQEGESSAVADMLAELLTELPLDAPDPLQRATAEAWARVAGADAGPALSARLRRKKAMSIEAVPEIGAFGIVFPQLADPWPMQRTLLANGLATAEKAAFLAASEESVSPRLVESLAALLDPRHPFLRRKAADLLMKIGTEAAARALQPHLAEEAALDYKLALAAFIGSRGFDDGFAYAIEHMSDPRYLEAAVGALAAIDRPGSAEQLLGIYRTSNDEAWKHAALRALGLLRYQPLAEELTILTRDLDHPLAGPALVARADIGDAGTLELLPAALAARREEIVVAAARAAGTLLAGGAVRESDESRRILFVLRVLARDAGVSAAVRHEALAALVAGNDVETALVLADMLRDRRLESTELLDRVRELSRERKVSIVASR